MAAEADLAAGRLNSTANRAYYAAFQAAIAALMARGGKPRGRIWEHRFVLSEFSGRLVRRSKVFPGSFSGLLDRLFELRVVGDYRPWSVRRSDATKAVRGAAALVRSCSELLDREG